MRHRILSSVLKAVVVHAGVKVIVWVWKVIVTLQLERMNTGGTM